MSAKTVIITGCSSGFGRLAVKTFHDNGWNVVATMRSPEKETELNQMYGVMVDRLDVTDTKSIDDIIVTTLETFGQIDAVVNNAGYGGHGMFEQFNDSHIHKMFDTNVYGPMRVARAVLPLMRKQRSGTIVNVTSMAGVIGLPFASTYSASKFAVEGWSEGLALECDPFGIKVHTVAPGAYGTNFNAATDNCLEVGDEEIRGQAMKMAGHFAGLADQMRTLNGQEANPQEVADMIYRCATEDMPVHNVSGNDAEMLLSMQTSAPQQEFLAKMSDMLIPQ